MKKVLLQTISYPGIGGIERSFEVLKHYIESSRHKAIIVSQRKSLLTKNTENEIYFEKKFKWLVFEPLVTYFSYKAFVNDNADLFKNSVLVVRYLPLSYALIKLNYKHIFIPPNVSVDFFDGIIENIKSNENKKNLKILKIIKWNIIKEINILFEKKVMASDLVDIITFSENVKRNLLLNNKTDKKIETINPGIDKRYFFRLLKGQINKHKKDLGINNDDFVVLYVGRISLGKNIDILIRAFNDLQLENKKLLLVGEGEIRVDDYKNIIKVGKKSIEDLHIYYSISNVLVLPTFNEGFGQVLIESLGCGTPVIGFDHDKNAIREVITEALFGLKATCCDVSFLCNTIEEVFENKNFYLENSTLIEWNANEKYNWQKLVDRILN